MADHPYNRVVPLEWADFIRPLSALDSSFSTRGAASVTAFFADGAAGRVCVLSRDGVTLSEVPAVHVVEYRVASEPKVK
jgi:hypothetical protein